MSASAVIAVPLLALLAHFLFLGGGETRRDYAWLARQDGAPQGFVLLEPQGVYHIGDVIKLRFGVAYDPRAWEVSHDVFESAFPLPSDFEVRSRKIHEARVQTLRVLETELTVQCLTCRDVTHYVDFDVNQSLRVRNRGTNEVMAIPWYDSSVKIRFAPLTDASYTPDERTLVLLPRAERNKWALPLIIGGGSALMTLLALMAWMELRRKALVLQSTPQVDSSYLARLTALKRELAEGDAHSIAYSLYALEIGDFKEQLEGCYSKEGIEKEAVAEVIERLLRGEV